MLQRRRETQQDTIAFRNRLSAQLMHLLQVVDQNDGAVTSGSRQRMMDLQSEWHRRRDELWSLLGSDLDAFNAGLRRFELPLVYVPEG